MPGIDTSGVSAAVNSADSATREATTSTSESSIQGTETEQQSEMPASLKTEEAEADVKTEPKFEVPDKNEVAAAIEESSDMMTAMESVAAMYRIPSTNIVGDPTTDRLSIVKGHIVVPTTIQESPSAHGKEIIQSIGAVLDYIAQRADDKLNQFQADNIRDGYNKEKIADAIDPSKGAVASTDIDDNGDPIVVYKSGIVGMSNTKEAQDKVDAIRNAGGIPEPKIDDGYRYFSDEDDISSGVDIPQGAGPETNVSISDASTGSDTPTSMDVASKIGESSMLLNTLSHYNNTRHLGYDIMQEQGFDFVKPVDFFTESAAKKKNARTVATGIEHMKFDNTNLLKAIKLMNEARGEQTGGRGKFSIEQLINSPKYQQAIDCLNDQFDMRLNVRFFKSKEARNNAFTSIWYNEIKNHLTISKSKGFQLGGLPIDVFIVNTALDEDAPDDVSLFGQHAISILCHEIFHNIMAVLKAKESQFKASLAETMFIASALPSASNRRKLISNYVNTLDEFGGLKLNPVSKRALVKHLTYISAISRDEQAMNEYEKAIKNKKIDGIDDQIKKMERRVRGLKIHTYGPGRYIVPAIYAVATFSWLAPTAGTAIFPFACMAFGSAVGALAGTAIVQAVEIDTINKMKKGTIKNYEEHWCDMFAAMYNLPVTFFLVGNPRTGASDNFTIETLKRYDALEREAMQLTMGKYPTINERNNAAVKYAKKTLDSKVKLDPAIKKYMEWIVANYSKTLDIDLDETYTKSTFDPKTAEDLDKHIEKLIGSANIQVTESDLSWLNDIGDAEYL